MVCMRMDDDQHNFPEENGQDHSAQDVYTLQDIYEACK